MTDSPDNSIPQDDDLKKALAAFGDDVLDLFDDDDDEFEIMVDDMASDSECAQTQAVYQTPSEKEASRNQLVDAWQSRFEAKLGQDSVLAFAGSVAAACCKASATSLADEDRAVVFSIGDQLLGLPIGCVSEIARCGTITSLPRTANWLCGVTNLRGKVVPVIDPRLLLQLPAEAQAIRLRYQKLIVVKSQSNSAETALLVEHISGIHSLLPSQENQSTQPTTLSDVSLGSRQWNEQTVVLLDSEKLLTQTEMQTYAG